MMLMLFVAVQLADVVTTDHALATGALEVKSLYGVGSGEPWSVVVVSQNDDRMHRLRHRVQGSTVMANGRGDRFFRCVRRD